MIFKEFKREGIIKESNRILAFFAVYGDIFYLSI